MHIKMENSQLWAGEWQSPAKRGIVPLDERFHYGKRLHKIIENHTFEVTYDQDFANVIKCCAEPRGKSSEPWLSPDLVYAYTQLHKLGYAHSVEVWHDGKLVGGEYGVAIGGYYSGESMFHREDHASRVAMVYLVEHLREKGFTLLDVQYLNPTSIEFGGYEVEHEEYLQILNRALSLDVKF